MVEISEKSFEQTIEDSLIESSSQVFTPGEPIVGEPPALYGGIVPGGYHKRLREEYDHLESDDKFMRHLAQVVRNGLGDRAGTCIDPKTQIVQGKTVCLVSCQRSPEPVFLKWKGVEEQPEGDFYVRSGPGSVKLSPESAQEYIRTRFLQAAKRVESE